MTVTYVTVSFDKLGCRAWLTALLCVLTRGRLRLSGSSVTVQTFNAPKGG